MTPARLTTAQFGTLDWHELLGGYAGRASWCGRDVEFILSCPAPGETEPALQAAASLFRDQPAWSVKIEACTLEELFVLKNRNWREEGEAALSRDMFLSRMRLKGISIGGSGLFSFRYDDDDMFWGHDIVVTGLLAGGPMRANLEG